jgi:hypothetical protein
MQDVAQHIHEGALFQLEDMLSRMAEVCAEKVDLEGRKLREAQREQQRLRFELISAVRREREMRSKVSFLEGQLLRAAELIAATSIHREPGWDGNVV